MYLPRKGNCMPGWVTAEPRRLSWVIRAMVLAAALILILVFRMAIRLDPYEANGEPRRMETHRQLGLPECRFVTITGRPCPACGLTTSFSLLMHGDPVNSARANWVGTLMACLGLLSIPWLIVAAMRGRYWKVRSLEASSYWLVGSITGLLILRWIWVLTQGWLQKQ
jgi:hypothetical protein